MGILLADEQIIYDMFFLVLSPIHSYIGIDFCLLPWLIAYNPTP
jgi:hypothetical protein